MIVHENSAGALACCVDLSRPCLGRRCMAWSFLEETGELGLCGRSVQLRGALDRIRPAIAAAAEKAERERAA